MRTDQRVMQALCIYLELMTTLMKGFGKPQVRCICVSVGIYSKWKINVAEYHLRIKQI